MEEATIFEGTKDSKLSVMGSLIRKLRQEKAELILENMRLKEENAALRGEQTERNRIQDREDQEVFLLARGLARPSTGCTRIVLGGEKQ